MDYHPRQITSRLAGVFDWGMRLSAWYPPKALQLYVDTGRQNTNHFHASNCFINSWHDIWIFLFWGPKLASLRHADPWQNKKLHLSRSWIFIKQLKSMEMICVLPSGIYVLCKAFGGYHACCGIWMRMFYFYTKLAPLALPILTIGRLLCLWQEGKFWA